MLFENQTTTKAVENIFSTFKFSIETIDLFCALFREINEFNKGDLTTLPTVRVAENNTVETNLLNDEFITVTTTEFIKLLIEYLESFKKYDTDLYVDILEICFNYPITELKKYIQFELVCYMIYSDLFFCSLDINKYFDYCKNDLEIIKSVADSTDLIRVNTELTAVLGEFYKWEFVENKTDYYADNLNMIKYLF